MTGRLHGTAPVSDLSCIIPAPVLKDLNVALRSCARSRTWRAALGLLAQMTHDQLEAWAADLITFNTLISAVSDQWRLAVHVLEWMGICGLRPDDISHSAVTAACEHREHRAGGWRSSVAELSRGVPAVNAALVALATAWPWAIAGLAGLLSRSALPDVISYSTTLGGLGWRGAWSLAKDMAASPGLALRQSLRANLIVQNAIGNSYLEKFIYFTPDPIAMISAVRTLFDVIDWKISVTPRQASLVVSGEGTPSVTLRGPFGYVGMSAHSFVADGMNEKGLIISVQTLYRSDYQRCNPLSKEYTAIWSAMLPNWILATFSTVAEVKDAINSGKYCIYNPVPGRSANTHWSIADAEGNSIVLEYERGQPKIYNNYVGVMTNDPFYPWQVENINTYISITSKDPSQSNLQMKIGDQLAGTDEVPKVMGHGFNTMGLPGDPSPPSRFVKMFFERQIALTNSPPKKKVEDWLTLVQGILNSIFITKGLTGPNTLGHYVEGQQPPDFS
eukprot:s188_g7.t4